MMKGKELQEQVIIYFTLIGRIEPSLFQLSYTYKQSSKSFELFYLNKTKYQFTIFVLFFAKQSWVSGSLRNRKNGKKFTAHGTRNNSNIKIQT